MEQRSALLLDLAVPPTFPLGGSWEKIMDAIEQLFNAEPDNTVQVGPGGAILLGAFMNAHVSDGMMEVFETLRREYPIASHEQTSAVGRLRNIRAVVEERDCEGYLTIDVRTVLRLLDGHNA